MAIYTEPDQCIRFCVFRQYPCARLAALLPSVCGDLLLVSPPSQLRLPSAPSTHVLLRPALRRLHHRPPTPFAAHLLLQPPGPRRMLVKRHMYDRAHLRSIKSKTISTDGGLSLIGQRTFGWMLTNAKEKQLVTGSGPIDGPATQASYTRSELHGFAAPLEYIHQLSRYYSMRPIKASTGGNVTVNLRSLELTFCLNSNNGGDNHTMLILFQI
jgi:hypothetical protein